MCCFTSTSVAVAALREAGYTVGLNTAWGCRFWMVAAPGRVCTHGYSDEGVIDFANENLD